MSALSVASGPSDYDEDDLITINIRSMDESSHSLTVPRCIAVEELKERVAAVADVPPERQRLIFRGKVLRAEETLDKYKVEDGHTLHLVARSVAAVARAAARGSGSGEHDGQQGGGQGGSGGLGDPAGPAGLSASQQMLLGTLARSTAARRALGVGGGAAGGAGNLLQTLLARAGGARGGGGAAAQAPPATTNSLEHVRQGLLSIRTIISTMPAGSLQYRDLSSTLNTRRSPVSSRTAAGRRVDGSAGVAGAADASRVARAEGVVGNVGEMGKEGGVVDPPARSRRRRQWGRRGALRANRALRGQDRSSHYGLCNVDGDSTDSEEDELYGYDSEAGFDGDEDAGGQAGGESKSDIAVDASPGRHRGDVGGTQGDGTETKGEAHDEAKDDAWSVRIFPGQWLDVRDTVNQCKLNTQLLPHIIAPPLALRAFRTIQYLSVIQMSRCCF